MQDQNSYTPAELLNAYLDGELDNVSESVFFRMLADNQDLRTELRDAMAVQTYVQRDSESLLPPAHLKQGVLEGVGFSAQPEARRRKRLWPLAWLSTRPGTVLTSALAGALLTLGAVWLLNSPESAPPQLTSRSNEAPANDLRSSGPEYPIVHSSAGADEGQTTSESGPIVSSETFEESQTSEVPAATRQRMPSSEGTASQEKESFASASTTQRNALTLTRLLAAPAASESGTYASQYGAQLPDKVPAVAAALMTDSPEALGLWLSMRGTANRSFPDVPTRTNSDPWFQNIGLGLFYDLDEQHAFGLELGQEVFGQRFRGVENGVPTRFEQRPLLFWLGGAYQMTAAPLESLAGIQPFVRLIAAGTETGPLGKALLGLQWRPDARVSLNLGLEGSLLYYQFQGTWFNSRKLGVSYGMTLSF